MQMVEARVPSELAKRAAILGQMFSALDIVDVAGATGQPLEAVAAVYFTLGDRLKFHWLRDHIEALPRDNRWRTLARSALRDDVYSQQATLTAEILRSVSDEDLSALERINAWVETKPEQVERTLQVLADINSSGSFDLSTLSVALREMRNLLNSSGAASGATPVEMETATR